MNESSSMLCSLYSKTDPLQDIIFSLILWLGLLHSTSPLMSLPDTGVGAGGLPQLAVIGVGLAISATDRLVLLSAESRAI